MAIVKYKGKELEHISIDGFFDVSQLDVNNIQKLKIELPSYSEYELLFSSVIEDITVTENNIDYVYSIYGNPVSTSDKITIDCYSKLQKTLDSNITIQIRKELINPIQAVTEILNEINIDYDSYSFEKAKQLRDNNSVEMFIVFLPHRMTMSYSDFIKNILNRVGCTLSYDVKNNRIVCVDYFEYRENIIFSEVFNYSIIDEKSIKKSIANDYYNKFVIGLYPILSVQDVYEYNYEVELYDSLQIKRTVFLNEALLSDVGIVEGTPTTLKYDWFQDGNYYELGARGNLTGVRQLYSVGLENETVQKKTKSITENGKEKTWTDKKNNSDSGIIKHINKDGAFWVGNRVIQTMYNPRVIFEFEYTEELHINVNDYVKYKNTNCIVISKKLKKDFFTNIYKLEEVLI